MSEKDLAKEKKKLEDTMKSYKTSINSFDGVVFELFGTSIVIKIVDTLDDVAEEGNLLFGEVNFAEKTIKIARNVRGAAQSDAEMYRTLLHELMHAIADIGHYNSYSNDEPFVEWTARCIYSLLEQQIINNDYVR